ncbi:hypothetical protein EOD41_15550 [Mucilaginibacter limnophilus]|uniref:Uncharacterized protein n=1 Tax=Mucilaginibacter limnophilus TaxID=1932778 RepID=A0A3S2UMU2_9SPHI|nr:DUF6263 family protein [Mucilaginibacter limnophilus]RVT99854.1 hypothetical protein EOD41_15550 [Mucilaginibacter limnophilus]
MKIIFCFVTLLMLNTACFSQKLWPHLQLKQAAVYKCNILAKNQILQTINGHQLDISTTINARMQFTVNGINDTLYNVKMCYDSIGLKIDLLGATLNYNSDTVNAKNIFSAILNRLKLRSCNLNLSHTGIIMDIDSIETVLKNITDSIGNFSASQKEQALAQLQQTFSTGEVKAGIEAFTHIYPEAPVSRTEKWVIDNIISGRMQANQHAIHFIKDVTAFNYVIEGGATINTADAMASLNGMPVKYRLAGRSNATITVDKKTGWIKQAKIMRTLKGNAEIQDNPKLPGGMLIPTETIVTISVLPDK